MASLGAAGGGGGSTVAGESGVVAGSSSGAGVSLQQQHAAADKASRGGEHNSANEVAIMSSSGQRPLAGSGQTIAMQHQNTLLMPEKGAVCTVGLHGVCHTEAD